MPHYEHFQAEDFLMDDHFVEWILHPSPETLSFWEDYKRKNPSKREELERAIELCRTLQLNNHYLTDQEAGLLKEKIRANMRHNQSSPVQKRFFSPWMAAAIISLVLVAGISIYKYGFSHTVVVETAYGQHQEVALPDGSVVNLNGNSSLRYSPELNESEIREVWLKGEAFFVVTKSPDTKFIVHTDDLDVEVLGTSFNVDDRESVTRVVLNTGSITVHLTAESGEEKILLKPGEMIEYKKSESAFVKQRVDPENYAAWKEDIFTFEGTHVVEIAQMLEARYGYEITIADSLLAAKFFTGRFSSENVDVLLTAMEKALGMQVVHEGDNEMVWRLN